MAGKVTNEVLKEKIENLKEYLIKHNDLQDKRIALQEEKTEKNTVAIAGMKGASGVIAIVVTFVMNIFITLFLKGIHQ